MKRIAHFSAPALLGLPVALILMFAFSRAAVAQTPPDLNGGTDHFACYEAIPQNPHPPVTISLTDACNLTLTGVQAFTPLAMCNPAAKTVAGRPPAESKEPNAHLTFYELTQKLPANRRKVVVNNQFGQYTLRVAAPKLIAVPTVKNGIGDLGNVERELSHFTCYEASGKTVLVKAGIQDQFHAASENILVHAPQYFCSPAEKTVGNNQPTDIEQNEDHLVCYKVTPSLTPPGVSSVTIENQFESNTLTVGPLHFLCAPSEVISCN
jgi:hypothetical protein